MYSRLSWVTMPTKETWVYVGLREGSKGLYQVWKPMDWKTSKVYRTYKGNAIKHAIVGGCYDVTFDGDSLVVNGLNGPKYKEQWPHANDVIEWEAYDQTAKYTRDMEAMARKLKQGMIREALEPIRLAMQKTNAQGRTAIKIWVLSILDQF
jgi:hypothetical protein